MGPKPDGAARAAAIGMALGRAGFGAAALFATRPALRGLGFDEDSGSVRALGRIAGARDLVLAGLTAGTLGDRRRLRDATLAAIAADAADLVVFSGAGAKDPELRRAAAMSAPAALAAVGGGLWLARRLS